MISLISAMSSTRVIGQGAGMPWNVPEEYAHYLNLVKGKTVIMGRTSHTIFGADLPASDLIVLSRSDLEAGGARVVHTVEEALAAVAESGGDVFAAGGARIYAQFLKHADHMHLSTIKGAFEGDAFFPEWDPNEWVLLKEEDHPDFVFRVFRRA